MTVSAMVNRIDLRAEFLQSVAKDLALPAQGKLREESRPAHFHEHTRFFLRYAQDRLRLLRMTPPASFSAACKAPPFQSRGERSGLTELPGGQGYYQLTVLQHYQPALF